MNYQNVMHMIMQFSSYRLINLLLQSVINKYKNEYWEEEHFLSFESNISTETGVAWCLIKVAASLSFT